MSEEQVFVLIQQNEALLARAEEIISVLGNLQGYAIFAVVVVLMIFSYKFLRLFF